MQLSHPTLGLVLLALSACAWLPPARPEAPSVSVPQPPMAPAAPAGLTSREPDTCKAASVQSLLGQPSGMSRTLRPPGPMRIIGPATVYDQEEYRSDRINLFTDGNGVIIRISCG